MLWFYSNGQTRRNISPLFTKRQRSLLASGQSQNIPIGIGARESVEHDAHLMYQAGEEMCRWCGAVRNYRFLEKGQRPVWILNELEIPECPGDWGEREDDSD